MDYDLAVEHKLILVHLEQVVEVKAIDGKPCGSGLITHKISLHIKLEQHCEQAELYLISSPKNPVILGLDWLRLHNPQIDCISDKIFFVSS